MIGTNAQNKFCCIRAVTFTMSEFQGEYSSFLTENYDLEEAVEQEYVEFCENIDAKESDDKKFDASKTIFSSFGKGNHMHSDTKALLIIFYDFLINLRDEQITVSPSMNDVEIKQMLSDITNVSVNTIYKLLRQPIQSDIAEKYQLNAPHTEWLLSSSQLSESALSESALSESTQSDLSQSVAIPAKRPKTIKPSKFFSSQKRNSGNENSIISQT